MPEGAILTVAPAFLRAGADPLGFFPVGVLLDGHRSALNQVLGALEVERCEAAHLFDNLDLAEAAGDEDDVEFWRRFDGQPRLDGRRRREAAVARAVTRGDDCFCGEGGLCWR